MTSKTGIIISKIWLTIIKLKKTAYHHYGNSPLSILKLFYYSGIRINTFLVFENELTRDLPDHNLNSDYKIETPTLSELIEIRNKYDVPREFYCDEVYNYKACYIALKKNEPAYLQWVVYHNDYYRFLKIPEDVVGFEYLVTMPKFRGNSLCAKMLAYTSSEFKLKGYRKVVSVIHESNLPAIKAVERVGYKQIAQIRSIGPFNRKLRIT